ncbi:MAG TPA: hypothetical protein VGH49_13375 [Xanthobacteraceae bacterium]
MSSRLLVAVAAIVAVVAAPWPAPAQECPTAKTGAGGFVVERNERQKSEVFHGDQGVVRTVMRYDGKTLLETTLYEGLFALDRLDGGRRTKYEPSSDLKALFPLRPGQEANAKFISETDGNYGRLYVELAVKALEDMYIGPCKYSVLRIERSESRSAAPPEFAYTEFYSPELKLIIGREYKKSDGRSELIKFDRIYPIKN